MNKKILAGFVIALAACKEDKPAATVIQTEAVGRRSIVVAAEATGTVEPVNVVEVKSKASGQITRMTVETASEVKRGDLLVQLDTRDVDQQYRQAKADQETAQARFDLALNNRNRQRTLYQQRVITEAEFQQGFSDSSSAQSALVRADAALDLAEQRRDDATVRAPIDGTVIEKTVSEGSVITSSTGSMGAGTTLLKMADLSTVRVRAHFNETDIANVVEGLEASVTVDAFPGQPFRGQVEKIEPTAVVQQSVTLFPVLIALDNRERKLKPGMNGEVRVEIDQRDNVLAVASDAIRTTREAEFTAGLLGLPADSVRKQVDAQIAALGTPGAATAVSQTSRGDVDISSPELRDPQQQQQQQPQQGRRGGGQGPGGPAPTAAECKPIADAYTRNPRVKARLDSLNMSMRSPDADRQAIMAATTALYGELKVDAMLARRCSRVLNPQAGGGQPGAGGQRGGNTAGAAQAPQGRNTGGNTAGAAGAMQGRGGFGGGAGGGFGRGRGGRGAGGDTRTGLVFVAKNGTYEPRVIRTGLASYDYTEVTAGLQEGEEVVLITSAQLQQQQQQQRDNARARQGGPLGQPGGAPGGGGRGPGGGGGGGGGGRGPGGN